LQASIDVLLNGDAEMDLTEEPAEVEEVEEVVEVDAPAEGG
jgi:hypothetical protein